MSEEMDGLDVLADSNDLEAILESRARELAREGRTTDAGENQLEIVEFCLGDETYGFELNHVREILITRDVTGIPCSPSVVRGVLNLRGQILSILDLKVMFELPDSEGDNTKQVIILRSPGMEFGILADAIKGVRKIPESELQDSLPTIIDVRAQYLKGVTGDRVAILDGEKLLGDSSLVVNEEC